VDAAGPFQDYATAPYRLAKAAIACGAHYLDLSDDAGFTAGVSTLDGAARKAGVVVLSGVSSVPAMSSAAVDALGQGMSDIHLIESVILPGNRAPRGLSVMRAILAQVGQPMRLWRGNGVTMVRGWSEGRKEQLLIDGIAPVLGRRSSLIGAPDLALFPAHYNARSVEFRAGLDLWVMHWGLATVGFLVRVPLLRSAEPLTGLLKWLADRLEQFGSDRGGMRVRVLGMLEDGHVVQRDWTLIAEAGDGPHIPAVAARVMCKRLLAGQGASGARPCLGEFSLQEAEAMMGDLKVAFGRREVPVVPLFQTPLGDDFVHLPEVMRDLHRVLHRRRWAGRAQITRGRGLLARLVCRIIGFPPAGRDVAVTVLMQRLSGVEHWQRDFAGKRFHSVLSVSDAGAVWERFGPFAFEIALHVQDGRLGYPVRRARLFGLPWPIWLTPKSDTFEGVDADGRATFDVAISLPFVGRLIHYQGWLQSVDDVCPG
ncbi:MAG: DUF4166 domain-containing protein, partial [Marinosulfonomonas sp.]|nr:DUF4166 domain-containing protein [Marinosulfonomonas sp.]